MAPTTPDHVHYPPESPAAPGTTIPDQRLDQADDLLREVGRLARELMDQHGLVGWEFQLDQAVRRFGCCYHRRKLITMSRILTPLQTPEHNRDTILHEIAHALNLPTNQAHGPEWKRIARRIGATPEARSKDGRTIAGRWTATCPGCGRSHRYHRRIRLACGLCSLANSGMRFDGRFELQWSKD